MTSLVIDYMLCCHTHTFTKEDKFIAVSNKM